MSRLLILSNGAPARAVQRALLHQALAGAGGEWAVTATAAAAAGQLRQWAPSPADLLVVDGGDGTLQAVLSWLLQYSADTNAWPLLCALPGGTTNMSASGLAGRWLRAGPAAQRLAELLASGRWAGCVRRHAVLVVTADGVRHSGLFFGTGAIVRGIEVHQDRLAAGAARRAWAPGWAVARSLWGLLRGDPAFHRPTLAGEDGARPARVTLLMATPLERLLLGFRPFAPGAAAGQRLHLTRLAAGAPRLWWQLPRLLAGQLAAGASGISTRVTERVELVLDGPWTLDGELQPAAAGPVQVAVSAPARWLLL